jgi:hypothetical protein
MKVTIENLKGRLRLRWTCPETGKRKNLALGLNDGISGRGEAARVKAWIETDSQHGYYDPTLVKYLPLKKRQQVTGITTVELFDRFTQYQAKHEGLSKASIDTRYKYLKVMLEKHLNIPASDVDRSAIDGFSLVCRKIKPDTAKQRIWLLKAAWDWGRDKFQLPDLNPWDGIAKRFDSVPVQPVPAFSTDEVKKILNGFRTNPHYANYLDYVRFRLSMATRPQEVRDLKWKDKRNKQTFCGYSNWMVLHYAQRNDVPIHLFHQCNDGIYYRNIDWSNMSPSDLNKMYFIITKSICKLSGFSFSRMIQSDFTISWFNYLLYNSHPDMQTTRKITTSLLEVTGGNPRATPTKALLKFLEKSSKNKPVDRDPKHWEYLDAQTYTEMLYCQLGKISSYGVNIDTLRAFVLLRSIEDFCKRKA